MTVIISDVPGVSAREVLDALADINPGAKVTTGNGGFVVDELTAYEFLAAYLISTGVLPARPAPQPDPVPDTVGPDTTTVGVVDSPPPVTTTTGAPKRRYTRRENRQ